LTKRERRAADLERAKKDVENAQAKLTSLNQPQRLDDKVLKPYLRQTFKLVAEAGDAKLCTNFTEYTDRFGPYSIDDPTKPTGPAMSPGQRALTHAVAVFFKNGGTKVFVVRVKSDNAGEIEKALTEFESIDDIAIVAAPGFEGKVIADLLVTHCDK